MSSLRSVWAGTRAYFSTGTPIFVTTPSANKWMDFESLLYSSCGLVPYVSAVNAHAECGRVCNARSSHICAAALPADANFDLGAGGKFPIPPVRCDLKNHASRMLMRFTESIHYVSRTQTIRATQNKFFLRRITWNYDCAVS